MKRVSLRTVSCVLAAMAVWMAAAVATPASAQEHATAAVPEVYILNTGMRAPYTTEDHQGFLDRLIAEAFRRIGLKARVEVYAASVRALINANENIDQGAAMRVKGVEKKYPNLVRVPEPVFKIDFVAYSRGLDVATESWQSLLPYTVAHIHGWVVFENNLLEGQKRTTVKQPEQMFTMLNKDRVDMVLYERWQGLRRASETGVKVTVHEPPLASTEMYMYVHKAHAHLIDKLDQALKDMKADGTYQKIYDQTVPLKTKLAKP